MSYCSMIHVYMEKRPTCNGMKMINEKYEQKWAFIYLYPCQWDVQLFYMWASSSSGKNAGLDMYEDVIQCNDEEG